MRIIYRYAVLLCTISYFFFCFSSCSAQPSARSMLSDFCASFGIEGVIYSPEVKEGQDGYISRRLFSDIYLFYGAPPENYAVMLNSRTDISAECGVFVTENGAELAALTEMCRERLYALGAKDRGVVIESYGTVFYSTFDDGGKTREIWQTIIRAYT